MILSQRRDELYELYRSYMLRNSIYLTIYGYAEAGIELMKKAGGEVISCGCIIELPELNGRAQLGDIPLYVLVEKEDTEGGLAE